MADALWPDLNAGADADCVSVSMSSGDESAEAPLTYQDYRLLKGL